MTISDSVTSIGSRVFAQNVLNSAHFGGEFGTFSLDMFDDNPTLSTITYDEGATGWSGVAFNNGTTDIPATSISLAATPGPTNPLWLLGIMAGLLSLLGLS